METRGCNYQRVLGGGLEVAKLGCIFSQVWRRDFWGDFWRGGEGFNSSNFSNKKNVLNVTNCIFPCLILIYVCFHPTCVIAVIFKVCFSE